MSEHPPSRATSREPRGTLGFAPIQTNTAQVWRDADGILHLVNLPGACETLETARSNVSAMCQSAAGRQWPTLIDIRGLTDITREAREFYAGAQAAGSSRLVALLVGSASTRMIGSFFVRLNKPVLPLAMFTNEAKALAWLKREERAADGC